MIKFVGLLGTYDDALEWIYCHIDTHIPKLFLWIGSSIGNLNRKDAGLFLKKVQAQAMQSHDIFLCGIDRRNEPSKVALAYNDSQGITREFILNGLEHINHIFESKVFDKQDFEYVSIYNAKEGRHEAYYKTKKPIVIFEGTEQAIDLQENEMIQVEYSYKYATEEIKELLKLSELKIAETWTDNQELYDVFLFKK